MVTERTHDLIGTVTAISGKQRLGTRVNIGNGPVSASSGSEFVEAVKLG